MRSLRVTFAEAFLVQAYQRWQLPQNVLLIKRSVPTNKRTDRSGLLTLRTDIRTQTVLFTNGGHCDRKAFLLWG